MAGIDDPTGGLLAGLPGVGYIFEEPGLDELQRQLAASAATYRNLKMPLQDARMQGMQQSLGMFAPAADMLEAMYGIRPPLEAAMMNPMYGPDGGVPALGSPENNARLAAQQAAQPQMPPEVPPGFPPSPLAPKPTGIFGHPEELPVPLSTGPLSPQGSGVLGRP